MAQQFLTANSFLGLGIEATRGTLASSITYIPITGPQLTPMQTFLRDEALRGSPTTVYNQIAGVRHDEYDVKGYMFADSFPLLLRAVLGSTDTKTGTTPTFTHVIGLLNDNTVGSQPPSVSIQDFDGANGFQMLAAQATELGVTFGAEVAAEWTAKFTGNPSTNISKPTATFSTEPFVPSWNATVSLAGSSVAYVQEGDFKIDRKSAPIFTMGTQGPRVNFAGPSEVTGRLVMVTEGTTDPFIIGGSAYGLYDNNIATVITLTDPVTSHSVAFQMTAVQFHDVKRNRGKQYVETEVNFTASANTTDAVSGGYSSIKTTTINGVSTTY